MKLLVLILSFITLSTETTYAMGRRRTPSEPTSPPITVPTPTNIDDVTGGLKVVIRQASGFNTEQLAKLNEAAFRLEQVLNSEEFKQRILHHTYKGQETFVDNRGYTNLQIYKTMMAGAEEWPKQTEANQIMDFSAQIYYSSKNVIGYTNQNTSTVYMNSRYFNTFTPDDVAENMVHEWTHKLGYDHSFYYNDARPHSVPYAVGQIVSELLSK